MEPTPPTAQEHFRAILRDRVAPELRRLGLRGSGQAYTLPDDDHFAQIGIQKSDSSSREAVKFTMNLSVVPKAAWAELAREQSWRGARPSANQHASTPGAWQVRIGHLLPPRVDQWWTVTRDADPRAVADVVVDAIRDYGLPAMRSAIAGRAEEDGYPGTVRPSPPGAPGLDLAEFARGLSAAMPGAEVEVVRVGDEDD
ncbi:DUF4304 domain-containing protein [Luteimicrobium sp. NPDC057192]|uniref:DUF4304 domain-containing protein n=1 Tax=Luteimicrobium sp. NPDC057192 TaxID=3346042 RepID=UPI0036365FFD